MSAIGVCPPPPGAVSQKNMTLSGVWWESRVRGPGNSVPDGARSQRAGEHPSRLQFSRSRRCAGWCLRHSPEFQGPSAARARQNPRPYGERRNLGRGLLRLDAVALPARCRFHRPNPALRLTEHLPLPSGLRRQRAISEPGQPRYPRKDARPVSCWLSCLCLRSRRRATVGHRTSRFGDMTLPSILGIVVEIDISASSGFLAD